MEADQFVKTCSSKSHTVNNSKLYAISKSKNFSTKVIKQMMKRGYINRGQYLCVSCYDELKASFPEAARNNQEETDDADAETAAIERTISKLINQLQSTSMEKLEKVNLRMLENLMEVIGETFVKKNIHEDGLSLVSMYRYVDKMADLDSASFLKARNQIVMKFLNGCCGIQYTEETNSVFSVCCSLGNGLLLAEPESRFAT